VGAIGILVVGERILEHDEKSAYRFKKLREEMDLPRAARRS
jgi:hypothetical protein